MPLSRHPLAFSLRAMVVSVGVVCVLAAWVANEWRVVRERRAAWL